MSGGDRRILVLLFVTVGLVTWRELKKPSGILPELPAPSAYVGTAIVYGIAGLISEANEGLGTALAAGWTLAIAYRAANIKEAPVKEASERTAAHG